MRDVIDDCCRLHHELFLWNSQEQPQCCSPPSMYPYWIEWPYWRNQTVWNAKEDKESIPQRIPNVSPMVSVTIELFHNSFDIVGCGKHRTSILKGLSLAVTTYEDVLHFDPTLFFQQSAQVLRVAAEWKVPNENRSIAVCGKYFQRRMYRWRNAEFVGIHWSSRHLMNFNAIKFWNFERQNVVEVFFDPNELLIELLNRSGAFSAWILQPWNVSICQQIQQAQNLCDVFEVVAFAS